MAPTPLAAQPWPNRLTWGLIAGLYLALAVGLTWPLFAGPGVVIGGLDGPDLVGTAWTWWDVSQSLAAFESPARTTRMFYPLGIWPLAQFNIVDAVMATPFLWLLGPLNGYNAAVIVMLAGVGLCVHLVARWEGCGHPASVAAGVALMSSRYIGQELWTGRVGQALVVFLVLGLGLWRVLLRREDIAPWRWVVPTAVVSALTFLSYWYFGLFLGFAAIAMTLADAPGALRRARLWPVLAAAAGTLALISPFVWMLLAGEATLPGVAESSGWQDHGAMGRGEAGLNWAIDFSAWLGWLLLDGVDDAASLRLGWVWAVGALVPLLVCRWRPRLGWIVVVLIGLAISIGPYPQNSAGEVISELSLPYLWLYDHFPMFSRFWWPYRAVALVLPACAVLLALNLDELIEEIPGRAGVALCLGVSAACVGEVLWTGAAFPVPATEAPGLTEAYAHIEGPLITAPLLGADSQTAKALWLQREHRFPLLHGLGGHIEGHRPSGYDEMIAGNAFLSALRAYDTDPPPVVVIEPSDIQTLRNLGFRNVLFDRALLVEPSREPIAQVMIPLMTAIFGDPIVSDERATIWRLAVPAETLVLDPAPGYHPSQR